VKLEDALQERTDVINEFVYMLADLWNQRAAKALYEDERDQHWWIDLGGES
jgi:hypothetical protein